jgi:hypothetical protein
VRARDLALGFMGLLCRVPLGPALIDFLGHMRADRRLARVRLGVVFPTPLGIGPGLDARAVACRRWRGSERAGHRAPLAGRQTAGPTPHQPY